MLPIHSFRDEIVQVLKDTRVLVLVGETGSGKTTQLPVLLYQAGFATTGVIGITQPRRMAVQSVARFVAKSLRTSLGKLVGYKIRHERHIERGTSIKFMTDGVLLREMQVNPDLPQYSVIVIDEAHERSINIDLALGLLKETLNRRPDLRVVIASATVDAQRFSEYFWDAPVVTIRGREHPVNVVYYHRDISVGRDVYDSDYMVRAIVRKVNDIHHAEKPGDVLVFVPGKDDVNSVLEGIERLGHRDLIYLPAHGDMPPEDLQKIFPAYPGLRKVIVATNIAETSITIDGIVYVVDSGLVKQKRFSADSGMESLDVVEHSQAGCRQRAGRAGRTEPGVCYRMYTESNFQRRPQHTPPEILRSSIASVILTMEDIGVGNIDTFDFIDTPDWLTFHDASQTLIALGATTFGKKGLTKIGIRMAQLPLNPQVARMLLAAEKYGCVSELSLIASFISVSNVFVRPRGEEKTADQAHRAFKDVRSDALGFLKIWDGYLRSNYSASWCQENYLNPRSLNEIYRVREQLLLILKESGMIISKSQDEEVIMRSVVAGLIYNLFEHDARQYYRSVFRGDEFKDVCVHPGSSIFDGPDPRWFVAAEVVRTIKRWARNCTVVKREWLREIVPHLFTRGDMVVTSYVTGSSTATVTYPLYFMDREAGKESTQISVAEAQKIQADLIRGAEAKGWQKLAFRYVDGGVFGKEFVSREGYKVLSPQGLEEWATYYCEVEGQGDKLFAKPQFQTFNFAEVGTSLSVTEAMQKLSIGGDVLVIPDKREKKRR